ncbi:MAG: sulfatase [Phycisphaeraceae bacterium JB051]
MSDTTAKRPNILWIMSDQHNASCIGAAGHPDVKTPNLDALATDGVMATRAYCNNPICGPSRCSMITGLYPHTIGITGNNLSDCPIPNPLTLPTHLRNLGYQTAMIGKGHEVLSWDQEGYEHIRYCDLTDADPNDPRTVHYFQYLVDHGLADEFDLGSLPPDHPGAGMKGFVSQIPAEHCVETWTGNESLAFLENKDDDKPFFLKMSFQRPHDPYAPSQEQMGQYEPEKLSLPENICDYLDRRFAGKPQFQQDYVNSGQRGYPYRPLDEADLKLQLSYHLTLITEIDKQIGRVIDHLKQTGEYENTIIVYLADHGDFAGEHGLMLKNLGIYESIHRVPMIFHYPGGPKNQKVNSLMQLVDVYPTLCEMAGLPIPEHLDGDTRKSMLEGQVPGMDHVVCEWDFGGADQYTVFAVRTERYRLVYYLAHPDDGELYDHNEDPGEINNLWASEDVSIQMTRMQLIQLILNHVGQFKRAWSIADDRAAFAKYPDAPTYHIHKWKMKWREAVEKGLVKA